LKFDGSMPDLMSRERSDGGDKIELPEIEAEGDMMCLGFVSGSDRSKVNRKKERKRIGFYFIVGFRNGFGLIIKTWPNYSGSFWGF